MSTVAINRYEKTIQRYFVSALKKSNIPVLVELAQDPGILHNYFRQRKSFYLLLMGNNVNIMDRALLDAICDEITHEIVDLTINNRAVYPGFWNDRTIGIVVLKSINITQPSDNPEGEFYLTWRTAAIGITEQELRSDPHSIPFSAYNEERLYDLCIFVQTAVCNTIIDEIVHNYPTALLHNNKETLHERYARELTKTLMPYITDFNTWRGNNPMADFSSISRVFGDLTNVPVVGYLSALLGLSGFSDMVSELMSKCQISATVTLPDVSKATANDFGSQANKINYRIFTTPDMKVEPIVQASLMEIRVSDLLILTSKNAKAGQIEKASARVGKAIETGLTKLVRFMTIITVANPTLLIKTIDMSDVPAEEAPSATPELEPASDE